MADIVFGSQLECLDAAGPVALHIKNNNRDSTRAWIFFESLQYFKTIKISKHQVENDSLRLLLLCNLNASLRRMGSDGFKLLLHDNVTNELSHIDLLLNDKNQGAISA
ncbi:MAG: hypothetical protein WCO97_11415 [bacterium]